MTARWVLGLDAVSLVPGAALWRDGRIEAEEVRPGGSRPSPSRPGDRLAECVFGVLERAGIGPGDLAGLAVTVGPGSFTGIRVGLAIAHGLLQGTAVGAVGIETCPAVRAASGNREDDPAPPVVLVQLRKTHWFLEERPGAGLVLVDAAEASRQVGGRRVGGVGALPPGIEELPLPSGLAASVARLGAAHLEAAAWPTMDGAQRVAALTPEYKRETYVHEAGAADRTASATRTPS